ncbi:hypothetical protein KP509_10G052400 [Ceratopteris richardii]|uniref:CUE domain-containing protein n=1 Tax=Ceratopteris richardii TaxID=49495 RepID=A0A8T2TZC7_CERRI|nr:hypothetical protein KP509_10G052400 [Ceratopteris richardii]
MGRCFSSIIVMYTAASVCGLAWRIQKLVERLMNYFILKGLFLVLIAQLDVMQITLWLIWLARLNASPAATLFTHGRVFAVLVLLCIFLFKDTGINTLLLLIFEPLSIALDTFQAIVVHGLQLHETWHRCIMDDIPQRKNLHPSQRSAAAAAWEWRGLLLQNFVFTMDVLGYMLTLIYCLRTWWLKGLSFKLVDGVLFRIKCALPDATEEELLAYDDDCAICKEPMGKAKQLPCTHLFHLPSYSCPTCRRPLFMGGGKTSLEARQHFSNGNQTREGRESIDFTRTNEAQALGTTTPNDNWSETDSWEDSLHVAPSNSSGSSSTGVLGAGQMHTVMHHFTGSARSHSQHESDGNAWGWWPFAHRMHEIRSRQVGVVANVGLDTGMRDSLSSPRMRAMVNTVREVMPNISEERIIQDLQRTNSVTTTVNNLL